MCTELSFQTEGLFPTVPSLFVCWYMCCNSDVLSLQEETVRLRKNVAQLSDPTAKASSPSVSTISAQDNGVNLPPMVLAYILLALIFGIVVGKFIL